MTVGAHASNPSRQGFNITLDSRVLKTPAKKPLAVPSEPLANAIAAEWECQVGLGAENGERIVCIVLGSQGSTTPWFVCETHPGASSAFPIPTGQARPALYNAAHDAGVHGHRHATRGVDGGGHTAGVPPHGRHALPGSSREARHAAGRGTWVGSRSSRGGKYVFQR